MSATTDRGSKMELSRKIGIGIVMIVPAFVGAGALWEIFGSWLAVSAWIVVMIGVCTALTKPWEDILPLLVSDEDKVLDIARQIPGMILVEMEGSPLFYIWMAVLAALALLAGYALLTSLVLSMEILEFSVKIPWAALVSSYTWLVVAGSGLCIINGLGAVFGMHRYEMMTKRIGFLSLISITFGLLYILLHLGRPERVLIYNIVSPNFRSAISWMGALYNIYLVVVVIEFWLLIRPDLAEWAAGSQGFKKSLFNLLALKKPDASRVGRLIAGSPIGPTLYSGRLKGILDYAGLPRVMGIAAFITGIAALTMLGSVFAHTESRALWYGPYYPVYFIISALFTGYALLLTVTIIVYRVRHYEMPPRMRDLLLEMAQVLAVLLAVGFALTTYRLVSGLFDPLRHGAVLLLLKGPFSPAFWIFEVGIMSVIPAFILSWAAYKKALGGVLWGSLLVLVGAFVMRYLFVVPSEIYPNVKEGLPSYMPTLMECFLVIGVFSAFLFVYSLGERFLPLKETEPR